VGPDARIVSARRLHGGLSSVAHALTVERHGETFGAVLKRPEVWEDEPGDPSQEVASEASILARLGPFVWAPQLLAVDPSGEGCGSPAILQALLPGKPQVAPKAVGQWLRGLSEATRTIATAAIPHDGLGNFAPWLPPTDEPPIWATSPKRWTQSLSMLRSGAYPEQCGPNRFIHRDLHPGNVLFHGPQMTGIVDWVHGCVGPIEADVSRCRVEIALLVGIDAADTYLDLCTDLLPTYDYRWDALVAIELSPWVEDIVECFNRIGAKLTTQSVAGTLNAFALRS
jgi:Phosphotransferase enzyme family